jgi:hypothetical protein
MSAHKGYAFQLYIVFIRPDTGELVRFANTFPFPPTLQRIFKPAFTAAMDWQTCYRQFGTDWIVVFDVCRITKGAHTEHL